MTISSQPKLTKSVDHLKIQVYTNRENMGEAAAADVISKIKELLAQKEHIRLVFAAAPSQNEFLDYLTKAEGINWSRVTAFHMDEYIGLPEDAPQKFSAFLSRHLFDKINLGQVHFIEGSLSSDSECKRYKELIKEAPIDLICLGIGENGHIAFNDPPVADFNDPELVKVVELDLSCRQQQVNDGCFDSLEDVPTHAITLTIPALMAGKHLYCIVPGLSKSHALQQIITGSITTLCPGSILRSHADCTLYADQDAYGAEI